MTKGIPTDPNTSGQWHLVGRWGLHADSIWPDYTGKGILVGILDDGFDYLHNDLKTNYRTDLDLDTLGNDSDAYIGSTDKHGTSVAGVIAADDNGQGGVGVAFDAGIVGIRQGFGSQTDLSNTLDAFNYARTSGLHILNNSWGFSNAFSDNDRLEFTGTDIYQLTGAMAAMASQGRGGLGTVAVFSGGNGRADGDNTNYHNFQNSAYAISVAAIKEDGTFASFSTKGASLLVSTGGTSLQTADVSGSGGYVSGDYTTFSGTSAAAPVVSGLVALMLEANKDLGWRDVQEILAYSAQHNDAASAGWQRNDAGNWNGGGLYFSHDYGFGAADAHAAVRLAETWNLKQTSANMVTTVAFNASPSVNIPATGTITTTINVTQNIEIEHVLVKLDIDHTKAGDLVVKLIAPDGTYSVLADHIGNGAFVSDAYGFTGIHFDMSSNAHWGEKSQGVWTLEVTDTVSGNSGKVNSWGLQFMGNNFSADDTYIYTEAFFGMYSNTGPTLSDTDGGIDTLNLAAIKSHDVRVLDDGQGNWSVQMKLPSGVITHSFDTTGILENVYTGDGADLVEGNNANNYANTGRGNDWLCASIGTDVMDGAAGVDMAVFEYNSSEFSCKFIDPVTVEFAHTILGKDTFTNVELFDFLNDTYTFAQLQTYFGGSATPPPAVPPANVIGLNFAAGTKSFNYSSSANEAKTLTGKDMGIGTLTAQYVKLERNGNDLKINYLSSSAPSKLTVAGSDANDNITIAGSHSSLTPEVNGGLGNDTITASIAVASLFRGGDGNDTLTGNSKKDVLYGDAGDDVLIGAADNDTLHGGAGNDTLNGDDGNDILNGDDGDDIVNGGNGNDTMNGGAGDDVMVGAAGTDTIYGGLGNDTINAGDANDTLYGDDGDDAMNGDAGDDKIYGGAGGDMLNGGIGNDSVYGGLGDDALNGSAGNDTLDGEDGDDTLNGDAGDDKLYGRAGRDMMNGGLGNDTLYGGLGDDALNGGDGNDTLTGEDGNDIINGDAGDDKITAGVGMDVINGGLGADSIYGDDGNDTINGDAGADKLYGGAGDDEVNGGADNDTIYGGLGVDTINAGDGADTVYGEDANDMINGGAGADRLYGDGGNDTMYGGLDADKLYGALGDDTLYGDAGADYLYGDAGNDTLYGGADNDMLYGAVGNDVLNGDAGDDSLYGEAGIDVLNGGDGKDRLYGGADNDILRGGAGDDSVNGDAGNDVVIGGIGKDDLYGGAGNDVFGFTSLDALDAVRDFATGDRLNISDLLTGFSGNVNDLQFFVKMTGTSTKTFAINTDGVGTDFVNAFTVTNVNGTVQDLFNKGILITDQSLA